VGILSLNIYMENAQQLTIADLASMHQLLEAAASRSAFKGIVELKAVSDLHDKLTQFLVAAQQAAQAQQEQTQTQGETNA
jgi:hypothetical protein